MGIRWLSLPPNAASAASCWAKIGFASRWSRSGLRMRLAPWLLLMVALPTPLLHQGRTGTFQLDAGDARTASEDRDILPYRLPPYALFQICGNLRLHGLERQGSALNAPL